MNAVSPQERLADAYDEYVRARAAKDENPTKTNVENYHRAHTLLMRLEKMAAKLPSGRVPIRIRG